jgi:hypothetical protein
MEVLLSAEDLAAGIGRLSAAVRQAVGRRPLTAGHRPPSVASCGSSPPRAGQHRRLRPLQRCKPLVRLVLCLCRLADEVPVPACRPGSGQDPWRR